MTIELQHKTDEEKNHFDKQITLTLEYDFTKIVLDILKKYDCFVGGGYPLSFFNRHIKHSQGDLDIWFISEEDRAAALQEMIVSVNTNKLSLEEDGYRAVPYIGESVLASTVADIKHRIPVQFIKVTGDIYSVLEKFDFQVAKIGFKYNKELDRFESYVDSELQKNMDKKILKYNRSRNLNEEMMEKLASEPKDSYKDGQKIIDRLTKYFNWFGEHDFRTDDDETKEAILDSYLEALSLMSTKSRRLGYVVENILRLHQNKKFLTADDLSIIIAFNISSFSKYLEAKKNWGNPPNEWVHI